MQSASIHISALILRDLGEFPDAFVNLTYPPYQLAALNNAGPVTYTVTGGALPSGMSLSANGILSGTPTVPGNYNWTVSFTDGADTEYRGFSINVYAISIETPGELPNATQTVPYNVIISAAGGAGGYKFSAGGLPNGLTLNSSGTIYGTVTAGPGRWAFSLTVTDSLGGSYSKQMSITVVGGTQFPSITLYGNGNWDDCTVGGRCGRNGYATGGVPPFTWSAAGLPPGLSIRFGSGTTSSYITPGDFELWGSPGATGSYEVQLSVTDSTGATTTNSFPLKVSSLIVDFQDNLVSGTIGLAYSRKLRVVGGAGPYTVSLMGGSLADGLSLNSQGLLVSGTPLENGTFFAVFEFTDAASNSIQLTNYYYISGGSSTIDIGTPYNLGSWTVGSHPDLYLYACCTLSYMWSVAGGSLPQGLDLSPTGNLTGLLSAAGTYTFLTRAADGSNAGYRQFVMTVTPIGVTTAATLPYGNAGTPYRQTLSAAGGAGTLNWTLAPFNYLPPGLTLSASGSISGIPTQTGQFQFTISVTDAAGSIGMESFNMAVYPPPVTRFVSAKGNDSNPGTIGQPYLTIQKCASSVFGGSNCMIRAGTYHETVIPNSGITIEPYKSEAVTVDGTDPVTNWTLYKGSIYKASVTLNNDDTNQLFVAAEMMTEARWPNGDDLFLVNWANTEAGTDDSHLVDSNLPNMNWTGAKLHLLSGADPWSPQTATVTGSSKGRLTITLDDQDFKAYIKPQAGGFYYLYRSLVALDKQREWFYDSGKKALYFWAPGGANPNSLQVRAKHRHFAFDLSGRSNVTIQDIGLFGCGINMNGSSTNNTLDTISAQYVFQFTDMPGSSPANPTSYWYDHTMDSGIVLNGSGNILRNSTIAWSAGNGVSLMGSGNTVQNNLIVNTGYAGAYASGINLFGTGHKIQNNTVHTSGRFSLVINSYPVNPDNNDIGFNNFFNSTLLSLDAGEIYSGEANVTGTRIHHNWLHDTQTPIPFPGNYTRSGVYLDEDANGFEVDQNVLWNNQFNNMFLHGSNSGVTTPFNNYVHNNSIPDVAMNAYIWLQGVLNCGTTLIKDNLVFEPVSQTGATPLCQTVNNTPTAPGANEMTSAVRVGCDFAGCSSSGPPAVSGTSIAPSIALQPVSMAVTVGQTATFTVAAGGSPTLTYQWRRNGANIPGANKVSYTTPATNSADNGALFAVQISNSYGSVSSTPAALTIETP